MSFLTRPSGCLVLESACLTGKSLQYDLAGQFYFHSLSKLVFREAERNSSPVRADPKSHLSDDTCIVKYMGLGNWNWVCSFTRAERAESHPGYERGFGKLPVPSRGESPSGQVSKSSRSPLFCMPNPWLSPAGIPSLPALLGMGRMQKGQFSRWREVLCECGLTGFHPGRNSEPVAKLRNALPNSPWRCQLCAGPMKGTCPASCFQIKLFLYSSLLS